MFEHSCAADAGTTIILLDITSAYDDIDRSTLRESISQILQRTRAGQRLSIRTIEDSFSHSRRLIDACIPFCPEMSWWQKLFSDCTEGVLLQQRRQLAASLKTALSDILESSRELPASDILRTIYYASTEEENQNGLSLYVFSDMIENSTFLGPSRFFSSNVSALLALAEKGRLIPFTPGAQVSIFGVGRNQTRARPDLSVSQMQRLNNFWQEYFKAAGAQSVDISPRLSF